MVSRSLEKMMLIAIGLTTVVLVGVPILLYSINTINAVSQFERAQTFSNQLHNATIEVDRLVKKSVQIELFLPENVDLSVSGQNLAVTYHASDGTIESWFHSYNHSLSLSPPEASGAYLVTVNLQHNIIEIGFTSL